MLALTRVAVTGGIASGKSEVRKIFAENGAYTVDSDEIVHKLLNPGTDIGKKVVDLLGGEIVVREKIDRARVAKKVFLNPTLLRSLEGLLHPLVIEEINKHYEIACKQQPRPPFFAAEIPLLFETKSAGNYDKTIFVSSRSELCWERFRRSTGYEREDFNRRRARFFDEYEKMKKTDYIIENNGSLSALREQANQIFNALCKINTPVI